MSSSWFADALLDTTLTSLRGNHGLAEDSIAKLRLQRGRRHEIDAVTHDIGKVPLKAYEFEQPNRLAEFDQQVNVAIVPRVVPSKGTKQ